ncbi:MAG: [citrate (pro-3S)-lyase] ligase [Treponema sp.]|nr:[citrate (pro-3S)-lyase] ligase [Treponema sp.]
MNHAISEIRPSDKKGQQEFDRLLEGAGVKRDNNLDYIAGLYDSEYKLLAAGACFANTLRCLAVDSARQGEGLMAPVVTHLLNYQLACGNTHSFLYTKCENDYIFSALGFHEITRVGGDILLMENRKHGFSRFLENLAAQKQPGRTAAIVMNCNPFTLGHRYLVEQAAGENDVVHLFVVSEDISFFPFADRYSLIQQGCADLPNVILHATESYMISTAVFPSYFLKDEAAAIEAQAKLDLAIFTRIAAVVGATVRYVGEEPFSVVTGIYNKIMRESLPLAGIECVVFSRKEHSGAPISASAVRKLLQEGRLEEAKALVPETTYRYFSSESGRKVLGELQRAGDVVHY